MTSRKRNAGLMRRTIASVARVRLDLALTRSPGLSADDIEAEADQVVKDLLELSMSVSMEMSAQLFGAITRSLLILVMTSRGSGS